MTSYFFQKRFHSLIAIDGPTFERKRGSYWEPQDALRQRTRSDSGLVIIECADEDDAKAMQDLVEGAGFEPGVDFGVASSAMGELLPCPGITFKPSLLGGSVSAYGSTRWRPAPMPEHLKQAMEERLKEQESFMLWAKIAASAGVDAATISAAGEAPTHEERFRRLVDAMKKPDQAQ